MKRIFISRELREDSAFFSCFPERSQVLIHGESLLDLTPVPFVEVPEAEWIFFSSRQAVHFFFTHLRQASLPLPPQTRLAVLGEGTARALKDWGKSPDFAGNGHPEEVGLAFFAVSAGQRILFPQAAHSRRSIQNTFPSQSGIIDLIVYKNAPRQGISLPQADVLIFTSPLNAQAYYSRYSANPNQRVIAIGESTRQHLLELGIDPVWVAAKPSESALAELTRKLLDL